MKTQILLSIFLAATLQMAAQSFAPAGAVWHYTQGTANPAATTFKTIETTGDTVIGGITCRKLIEVERYTTDTAAVAWHYMHAQNDSVFFYAGDAFHLLYDFGALAGDTIELAYFETSVGTPLQMIIDSTGTIMVNAQERTIQYITCGDGISIEFGHHVISGIGSTSFMFPTPDLSPDGPLRCYRDDSTGVFLSPLHPAEGWNHEDCEEFSTGIGETAGHSGISVFPNPAGGAFSISGLQQPAPYTICDLNGKVLLSGRAAPEHAVDISALAPGVYLIRLRCEEGLIVRKLVKK